MLLRLGLHGDYIKRLCFDVRHMFNDQLRRGQRVCGRVIAARRVRLQCGVCIVIDHDDRMRGQQWHVRCVWCRLQLRW